MPYLPTPDRWRFTHTSGEEFSVSPHGPLRANNGDVLRPMLLAGLGLAVQPEFLVWEDLAAGKTAGGDGGLVHAAGGAEHRDAARQPSAGAGSTAVIEFLARRLAGAAWAHPVSGEGALQGERAHG